MTSLCGRRRARTASSAQCDFLICVLPLTDDTRHILNAAAFAKLPKGAYVINIARGGHVKQSRTLIAALDSGHLSGATLDVFEIEPLPQRAIPIWKHPKIIATPHIAAITHPTAATRSIIDGIVAIERGETPKNVVDMGRRVIRAGCIGLTQSAKTPLSSPASVLRAGGTQAKRRLRLGLSGSGSLPSRAVRCSPGMTAEFNFKQNVTCFQDSSHLHDETSRAEKSGSGFVRLTPVGIYTWRDGVWTELGSRGA